MKVKVSESVCVVGSAKSLEDILSLEDFAGLKPLPIDIVQADGAEVDIKSLREIIAQLSGRPYGETRLFYLQNAELLSEACQDTLLKVVEEPSPALVIILHATNRDKLLSTLQSRMRFIDVDRTVSELEIPAGFLTDEQTTKEYLASLDRDGAIRAMSWALAKMQAKLLAKPDDKTIRRVELINNTIQRLVRSTNLKLTMRVYLLHWFEK